MVGILENRFYLSIFMLIFYMSYVSKFQYQKNNDNELVAAIFPLNEILIEEQQHLERLGGGSNDEHKEGSRFDGLGVPIGLYLSKKQISDINNLQKNPAIHKDCNVIDEQQFNELIDKIIRKSKKKNSYKNYKRALNRKTKRVKNN
jgi:hypothetical protein